MSKSTAAFMANYIYGVEHGPHARTRFITKVHDLRIEREVARLNQHTPRKRHV